MVPPLTGWVPSSRKSPPVVDSAALPPPLPEQAASPAKAANDNRGAVSKRFMRTLGVGLSRTQQMCAQTISSGSKAVTECAQPHAGRREERGSPRQRRAGFAGVFHPRNLRPSRGMGLVAPRLAMAVDQQGWPCSNSPDAARHVPTALATALSVSRVGGPTALGAAQTASEPERQAQEVQLGARGRGPQSLSGEAEVEDHVPLDVARVAIPAVRRGTLLRDPVQERGLVEVVQ